MESTIDNWYGDIVAKTLRKKVSDLVKAKRRYRLVEELMKSAKEDVVEARRQLRKWQRKAVVGRTHCCKLKAQMSVAGAVEVVQSDVESDSSQSTSSSSSSSSRKVKKGASSQSTSSSSGKVKKEVEAVQSRLKGEVAPMSVESVASSAEEEFRELTSGWGV